MENSDIENQIVILKPYFQKWISSPRLRQLLNLDTKYSIKDTIHRMQKRGYPIIELRNGLYTWIDDAGEMKKYLRKYSKQKQDIDEKMSGMMIAYSLVTGVRSDPLRLTKVCPVMTSNNLAAYVECELNDLGKPILPNGYINFINSSDAI